MTLVTDKSVALITGANKGLGFEIARQLGKRGLMVIIGARDKAKGENAAADLAKQGIEAHAVKLGYRVSWHPSAPYTNRFSTPAAPH